MNLAGMRTYRADEAVDAVVVGTGAGGAPLIARLAAAGLKVVALEAGPNFTPERFAFDETLADEIYWTEERLSGGSTPEAFGANNSGTGVGGSTLHWGAFVPRADARDLRLHTESGEGVDWPLSYEDLLPFYERVERFLGVSGAQSYPWDAGRRYPLPPSRGTGRRRSWRGPARPAASGGRTRPPPWSRGTSSPRTGPAATPASIAASATRAAARAPRPAWT